MASLSLCLQLETNLMSNRKVIELVLKLKSAKAHGKNYIKVKPHLVRHLLRNHLLSSRNCHCYSSSHFPLSVIIVVKIQLRHLLGIKTSFNRCSRGGGQNSVCNSSCLPCTRINFYTQNAVLSNCPKINSIL